MASRELALFVATLSQPKLRFLVPLSGLQGRSSWITWSAFSQNRDPPIPVYFPGSGRGGPGKGRLLGCSGSRKSPCCSLGPAPTLPPKAGPCGHCILHT